MVDKLAVIVIAAIVAGAGCAGQAPKKSASGVIGTVDLVGGPPPGHPKREADVRVIARAGNRIVRATILHPDQDEFELLLKPGPYRLEAEMGGITCESARVSIPPSARVSAKINCSLK